MFAKDVREFIDKYSAMLPTNKEIVSKPEAEYRATEFLRVLAHLTNWKHHFLDEKIKAETAERSMYSVAMDRHKNVTVTERRIRAEADPEYQQYRERVESLQNDVDAIKDMQGIFTNGHLFYRQYLKGEY